MKLLSVLLVAMIVFLSAFSGTVKPAAAPADKTYCCHRTAGKTSCPHSNKKSDDCSKTGCATMLSCNNCGFLVTEIYALQPRLLPFYPKPYPLYKIGDLSTYASADWKPPKAC